jgi:hypothetical protein
MVPAAQSAPGIALLGYCVPMVNAGSLILNACFIIRWVYFHGVMILPEYFPSVM